MRTSPVVISYLVVLMSGCSDSTSSTPDTEPNVSKAEEEPTVKDVQVAKFQVQMVENGQPSHITQTNWIMQTSGHLDQPDLREIIAIGRLKNSVIFFRHLTLKSFDPDA